MNAVQVAAGPRGVASDLPATLHLRTPLAGLPGHEEFSLSALDDSGVLFALRSASAGMAPVRLFVIAPGLFFPDYAPLLDPAVEAALGSTDSALVPLVIVHPADGDQPMTANLLAPLLVDPVTGSTAQVVLEADWPLRAPIA
ncbi:flagellar assembly protein FliW [Cellulomonas sp. P22]|uniref:flagellar assembly protein FliW n=1 Tax=Cellulomonas sp. P22 TaxID=3373189 RepID=UPI00379A67A9